MSTSYYFKCNKCKDYGGMYTRQAGGWGNFYVVTTFKFLAWHTENCGAEYIRVVHEDDMPQEVEDVKKVIDFLEKTKDFFPGFEMAFSDGTRFDTFGIDELKEEWHNREMKEAKDMLYHTSQEYHDQIIRDWDTIKSQKRKELNEFMTRLGHHISKEELDSMAEQQMKEWFDMIKGMNRGNG